MNSDRIEGAVREVGGRAEQQFGRLTGDDGMRGEGLAREATGLGQNLYGQAVDGLRGVADDLAGYADEAYDRGTRALREGASAVEARVDRNPVTGVLIAAGIGFLLGTIVSRR